MKKLKNISIVIPVFNEEHYIEETLDKVLKSNTGGLKKEIIIVDDFSTDGTVKILKKIEKINKNIKIFYKKKNEGKGSALKLALLKSTGDIVLIQDADLEYSPDDYPQLLEPFLKSEADCGMRSNRRI